MLSSGTKLFNDFSQTEESNYLTLANSYNNSKLLKKLWRKNSFSLISLSNNINYTNSGINSPARFTSKPLYAKTGSHNYDSTILNDILSKRKAILSNWILARSGSKDYKLLFDLNTLNKSDKELDIIFKSYRSHKDSLLTNMYYLRNLILEYEIYISEGKLLRQAANYFMPVSVLYKLFLNNHISYAWLFIRSENFTRQQIQLRKGISNMNKLHATNVIALPIETRIRVLASSKDIIHSWAIPAAGIKVDCVPGFTSHRIIGANIASIYTGQCMEICGRFHHWMPIVAYFIKKDMYYIWLYQSIFRYFDENVPTVISSNGRKVALVTFARGLWHFEFYNPTTGLLEGDE
jgi:cytochrome c oxidase subunit 2